jgi:hypothetical protein
VNEYVFATILFDKTKSLCIIKPFNCTFCHLYYSFITGSLEPLINRAPVNLKLNRVGSLVIASPKNKKPHSL